MHLFIFSNCISWKREDSHSHLFLPTLYYTCLDCCWFFSLTLIPAVSAIKLYLAWLPALPFALPHCCADSSAGARFSWSHGHPQSAARTPHRTSHPLSSLPTSSPPLDHGSPASLGHSHTDSGCLGYKLWSLRGQLQLQLWHKWKLPPCCLKRID